MRRRWLPYLGCALAGVLLAAVGCSPVPERVEFVPYRAPLWTFERYDDGDAVVVGDLVVAEASDAVMVVDRKDGGLRWRLPRGYQTTLHVGDAAIVEYGVRTPRAPEQLRIVDLATGESSPWQDLRVAAITRDTLVTERCGGASEQYRCVLTAVDLATRAVLWRTTDPPSRVVGGHRWTAVPGVDYWDPIVEPMRPPDSPYVLFVKQDRPRMAATVMDVRTGQRLASWLAPSDSELMRNVGSAVIVGTALVTREKISDTVADCRTRLTAYDLMTGQLRWRADAATWQYGIGHSGPDVKVECDYRFQAGIADTTLIVAAPDRRPQLIDVTTGAVHGFGAPGMAPIGFDAGVLVVQDFGKTRDIVAFDYRTERERWRISPHPPKSSEVEGIAPDIPTAISIAVLAGRLVYHRHNGGFPGRSRLYVADVGTGHLIWSTDDARVFGAGAGWMAAGDRRDLRMYQL